MTKILITGGSGLLGSKLIELSDKKWDIFSTYKNNKIFHNNVFPLELKNKKAIEKLIDKIKPELVIHTAAITNIDWAESHPNETFEINVNSTKSLLSYAKNIEADFFYISTDSVFDGEKGCYNENDIPNPINVYSKSKFEAEKIVEEYERTTVIRTSFFGFSTFSKRESFPIQILNNLIHKKPIYAAEHKKIITKMLQDLKKMGKKIVAYGMSGRGNTLLNYWNVGIDIIDYGIDASPERYGRFVPGMHIPIKPPENALEGIDVALLLAWIFADDIMKKEKAFTDRGGKFLIPLPIPHLVP